jgi:hypothetical protein
MATSDEYRKVAEEYDRLAREAKTEADRLALLNLAETWFDTASRQDDMTPEQIAEVAMLERELKSKAEQPKPQNHLSWWQRVFGLFRTDENDMIR